MHSVDSCTSTASREKRRSASNWAYDARRRKPLAGIGPMPRHFRGTTSNTSHHRLGLDVSLTPDEPGILVFQLRATFFQLPHASIDALKKINGFETGDHDGYAINSRPAVRTP